MFRVEETKPDEISHVDHREVEQTTPHPDTPDMKAGSEQ